MPRRKISEVDKAVAELEKVLAKQYQVSHAILKQGKQIIIPEYMSEVDAIKALQQHVDEREETASRDVLVECHPDDGLNALFEAITGQFGHLVSKSRTAFSFFGPQFIPAQEHPITIGYNETKTVPVERVSIPGMGGKLSIYVSFMYNEKDPMRGKVNTNFEYKKMYEPLVDGIENRWKEILRDNSIFKGKAIDSNWNFLGTRLVDTSKLVYAKYEQASLDANLFMPIRQRDHLDAIGEQVRRTVLLSGTYGTGKSFTALKVAQVAEQNGWTFINVDPGAPLEPSLDFAKRFQPSVVFMEDVDRIVGGERDMSLDRILNKLDGILTKDNDVIVILTTNNLDDIHESMLRPGRIDDILRLGKISPESVTALAHAYGGKLIDGELEAEVLFKSALGDTDTPYPPAFVVEAVRRAMRYALADNGDVDNLKITSQDIENALVGLKPQFDLMNADRGKGEPTLDDRFQALLKKSAEDSAVQVEETIVDRLEDCALRDG